jgi:hypothetical protein
MKLSPELLRSLALGIGLSTMTACTTPRQEFELAAPLHDEACTSKTCADDCEKYRADIIENIANCPGCGMG